MARSSQNDKSQRVVSLLAALEKTYPDAHCELRFRNPLELLVATVLSAQCSDVQVNRVTESLFQKYRSAKDYAEADIRHLEEELRRLGLFRLKARNIQGCCRRLIEEHGGRVPDTLEALVRLDGVGRKTANVVLGNAFGATEGIVVDTHVTRLAGRLGLSRGRNPIEIERDLMRLVPRKAWTRFSHWLIWHGRRRCRARNPDCGRCEIAAWCPSSGGSPGAQARQTRRVAATQRARE